MKRGQHLHLSQRKSHFYYIYYLCIVLSIFFNPKRRKNEILTSISYFYIWMFNRNTIKISYICMSNIRQRIDNHNKAISSRKDQTSEPNKCNCRQKSECPMNGHCLKESIVYQATVTTQDERPDETYIGLTENTFKTRYTNHKASFTHQSKRTSTELSKYIWELKDDDVEYKVTWKALKQARSYNSASNRCNLCLWEKYYIICKPKLATLNKRNELVTACRHASKFLLKNFVT